jgi:hypothetical protein
METILRLCDFQVVVAGRGAKRRACGDPCHDNQPTKFGLGDVAYTVDLCAKHIEELKGVIAPFVSVAQSADKKVGRGMRKVIQGMGPTDSFTEKDVRDWCKHNGIEVKMTGRLPNTVVTQYREALASAK